MTGRALACGGFAGDYLHHVDGTRRATARSANGRELELFERECRTHLEACRSAVHCHVHHVCPPGVPGVDHPPRPCRPMGHAVHVRTWRRPSGVRRGLGT